MMEGKKEQSVINQLIKNFVENLNELRELLKLPEKYEKQAEKAKKKLDKAFLPILISQVESELKNEKPKKGISLEALQEMRDELIANYKKVSPESISKEGKLAFKVDEKYFKSFKINNLSKESITFKHSSSHKINIEKAVLFNLISYLEQSFSDLSHIILKRYPEILCLNEKSLTFEEIKNFSDLEDARDYLISLEIEKLLFKPVSSFFEFFEEKVFKKELPNLSELKNEVIEIKARRNLFIHNGGTVNSIYLNIVEESLQKKYKIEKDKKIRLEKDYLRDSIDIIELIGLEILFYSALKFQNKEDSEAASWMINETVYSSFAQKKKNYFLGEHLCCLALDHICEKYLKDIQRDYIQLNYWYILKKQNKFDIVKDKSSGYDTSSKNHIIKLCFNSLMENYAEAYKEIEPSLKEKKFSMELYEKFPILEDLRKKSKAKDIIKKIKQKKN